MKKILVCLHGWGGTKDSFAELRSALKHESIEILTPDLPGFGNEPEPSHAWTTDDYADWVDSWVRNHIPKDRLAKGILLLGHSHGGRIALKLAHRQSKGEDGKPRAKNAFPITHLYLCAAAGIRHPRHFKRIIGLTLSKAGTFLLSFPGLLTLQPLGKKFLYKLVRVHDYERASPVMRDTLIKVTAEDLRPLLPDIHVPTDLFWGRDDGMTPVSDGKLMHSQIGFSTLHIFPSVRHGVHRERAKEIAGVICGKSAGSSLEA